MTETLTPEHEAAGRILSPEAVRELIAARQAKDKGRPEEPFDGFEFIRPLEGAVTGLVDAICGEGRFMTGFIEVDVVTRGFGKGHLVLISGRSHSGKTQFLLNALRNNPLKHVLWITADEPAELVVQKLACITLGLNAETMEHAIKSGDTQMVKELTQLVNETYPHLLVVDRGLRPEQIWQAIQEARHVWGANEDMVVFDYLEQLPVSDTSFGGVTAKVLAFKALSQRIEGPMVVIHQNKHGGTPRGQAQGLEGMRFGGEDNGTFVIEVFRKREDPALSGWEKNRHEHTITVNVCKNKIPPARKKMIDLFMDEETGLIRALRDDDLVARPLDKAVQDRIKAWEVEQPKLPPEFQLPEVLQEMLAP